MIIGIGTDIVNCERMQQKIASNDGLKNHLFAVNEIEYCEKQKNSMQHFAARFAAKEALLKATGKGMLLTNRLSLIEVVHHTNGQPHFQFNEELQNMFDETILGKIHLSISHDTSFSIATVIVEK